MVIKIKIDVYIDFNGLSCQTINHFQKVFRKFQNQIKIYEKTEDEYQLKFSISKKNSSNKRVFGFIGYIEHNIPKKNYKIIKIVNDDISFKNKGEYKDVKSIICLDKLKIQFEDNSKVFKDLQEINTIDSFKQILFLKKEYETHYFYKKLKIEFYMIKKYCLLLDKNILIEESKDKKYIYISSNKKDIINKLFKELYHPVYFCVEKNYDLVVDGNLKTGITFNYKLF